MLGRQLQHFYYRATYKKSLVSCLFSAVNLQRFSASLPLNIYVLIS
jgi:hypothetical protein